MLKDKPKEVEYKFKIFTKPKERAEIREISSSLARYLHENNIQTVVLIDVKSRLVHIGLANSWSRLYPNEKKPQIYFVNPEGFNANRRFEWKITQDLLATHKYLMQRSAERVMVFDTCIHSGGTCNSVVDALRMAGFNKIHIGCAQPQSKQFDLSQMPEGIVDSSVANELIRWMSGKAHLYPNENGEECKVPLDFTALDRGAVNDCYVFERDKSIEKTRDSVISFRLDNNNKKDFDHSRQLRREISEIFSE
jgi:hypothetical protein